MEDFDDRKIKNYIYFVKKAKELQSNSELQKIYEEQCKKSKIIKEKMDSYYELRDKVIDLYKIGVKKIDDENFKELENFSKIELLIQTIKDKINNTDKYKKRSRYLLEIPELKEAGKYEQELEEKFFDYAYAHLLFDREMNETKMKLFSKEYLKKMDEYADEGILLYFLETPDFPILDENITKEDFMDALLFNKCYSIEILFYSFLNISNPTPSMKKKIEDIIISINNLSDGFYRSAARNIFALLESEHKNIANSLEGFFEKEKIYKNGKQRSNKIKKLVELSDMTRVRENWEKFNNYYEKIVTSSEGAIDRNAIIHGDYYSKKLDITAYDVVKLLLLFLSFRCLSDYIQNHINIFEQVYQYVVIHMARDKIDSKN